METLWGNLVPLAFVILVFGGGIIQRVLSTWEKRMEMQAQRQQGQNDAVTQQLAAVRAELAALRDTSTQFDMSVEQSIQRLEERVGRMESKAPAYVTPPPSEEQSQQAGTR